MKRNFSILLLMLTLLHIAFFCLSSCAQRENTLSCRDVLDAMMSAEPALPSGKVYDMAAEAGEGEYLSANLIRALLLNDSLPDATRDWLDCAFYLSTLAHPCELAAVLCRDHDTAKDTATLFSARLAAIRLTKTDEKYAGLLSDARIVILDNYVLFIVSSDPDGVLKAARSAIRSGDGHLVI